MKISIITVCYNSAPTIAACVKSVLSQKYADIEYIVIDGGSEDGTIQILNRYADRIARFVSESDGGIYDAMNKGICLASGDVVGILNSDDVYIDNSIISLVADVFKRKDVQAVFGDLVYVKPSDTQRVVRYYSSASFTPDRFAFGWMPAHPTFFVKRACYNQYGLFKTDYRIASDFELLARFLGKHRITYQYIPKVLVKMRAGGLSTRSWRSNLILNREIVRACSENGIKTNYVKVYSKYFTKIFQLLKRTR